MKTIKLSNGRTVLAKRFDRKEDAIVAYQTATAELAWLTLTERKNHV